MVTPAQLALDLAASRESGVASFVIAGGACGAGRLRAEGLARGVCRLVALGDDEPDQHRSWQRRRDPSTKLRGRRHRRRRVRPAADGLPLGTVPEFDGADDQHLAVVAAALPTGRGIVPGSGWPRRSRPDPTAGCARGRPWPYAACVRAARRFGTSRYRSGVAARDSVGMGRHQVKSGEGVCLPFRPSPSGHYQGVGLVRSAHPLSLPHSGRKPPGQRIAISQAAQASSSGNMLECEEAVGDLFHLAAPGRGTNRSSRSTPRQPTRTTGAMCISGLD